MTDVVHITTKWLTGIGGVKTFIRTAMHTVPRSLITQRVLSVGEISGESVGGIHPTGPIVNSTSPVLLTLSANALSKWLKKESPDVVHIHTNNSLGFLYANAAKRAGVPRRIVHAHNSSLGDNIFYKKLLNDILYKIYNGSETVRLACAQEAGSFLFKKDFSIINNGINLEKFRFNQTIRESMRKSIGLGENDLAIIFVGAFQPPKNLQRAINIFETLTAVKPNTHLLLFGTGTEKESLSTAIENLKRSGKKIHDFGVVQNLNEYYSAGDVLLMTSFYEGLPITLIEAQANSLPSVISSNVSPDALVTDLGVPVSLDSSDDLWASALVEQVNKFKDRRMVSQQSILKSMGYSAETTAKQLMDIYTGVSDNL